MIKYERVDLGVLSPLCVPVPWTKGPGSFLEVTKILPLLTSPSSKKDPSFHVVAFSLPGYGFSEAPTKKGFSATQYAEVGHKLMQRLGYEEYGAPLTIPHSVHFSST